MSATLNNTQLEILNLFSFDLSEQELKELKALLAIYLADKLVREANAAFDAKNYPTNVFEKWKKEHFRKTA